MKKILRQIFPFVITVMLWYLTNLHFNPFGSLAIIPIFYYMFLRPVKYWFPFGLFMCFLLDFNAGSLFLFSSAFLLMNALNVFFGILEKDNGMGFYAREFNIFLGIIMLFMFIDGVFFTHDFLNFIVGIMRIYFLLLISYFPFVALFRRVGNDR